MSDMSKGYKKTELGVIPIDRNLKKFEDVMTGFSSGATPYRGKQEYYKGETRWITSGELNYNLITDTIEKNYRNCGKRSVPKSNKIYK